MTLTTAEVWDAIANDGMFGVLAFVNRRGEARSVGVIYVTHDRSLLISTARDTWKVRHTAANPNVSMTITFPKRVPFLPFIRIPAATITFSGTAEILDVPDAPFEATRKLLRGLDFEGEPIDDHVIIRVTPRGDFVTYGIGMPITQMRSPEKARDRVPSGTTVNEPTTA
ncbi:MAG: hypothetical protein HKO76_11555 [Acidimicrobiia bacterium]|nr:hypothetical protein [Acidimicrobiia bacterium]